MKIEQAQELVFEAVGNTAQIFEDGGLCSGADKLREAIKVLLEGEQPVEVVNIVTRRKCRECGHVDTFNFTTFCPGCKKYLSVRPLRIKVSKTHTTHRRLTIETVESVPVVEEIDE